MDGDPLLGTMAGRWRITRAIGAGGMGRVYLAVQPDIGARVAIKVLRRDLADQPRVVERFVAEARAASRIAHDNIVKIIDLAELPDGAPYIVMEYLDGASLGAILRRTPTPPVRAVVRVACEVLAALEVAHAAGVVHRDLKPDNVFVGPRGRVTVLDFGIAKIAEVDPTVAPSAPTTTPIGTPQYMAPEQTRCEPSTPATDLYAVGVILYQAVTGVLPFTAPSLYELLRMQVEDAPVPPRERTPGLPAALDAAICKALAKQPGDRFATAAQMRGVLLDAVAELPEGSFDDLAVASQRVADPYAATAATGPSRGRVARRSRGAWVAVAAVAVAVIAAAVAIAAMTRATPEAAPVTAAPRDAAIDAALPTTPGAFVVAEPSAVDPVAYYTTARDRATRILGAVDPTSFRWYGVDRAGHIDLTRDGFAEYFFVSRDPAMRADCYVRVALEHGGGQSVLGEGDCAARTTQPPRCSSVELWRRADAMGSAARAAERATVNRISSRTFQFTAGSAFSEGFDDDCAPAAR